MFKQYTIVILLLITVIIAVSGCTNKTASNGTFGEKFVSVDSIFLSNNTTSGTYNYNGTKYYYIEGYLINNNSYDAFHVVVNSTAYDVDGNAVGTNNSAYISPITIPAKSISYFYVDFNDTNNKIVRYDTNVVSASGTM